MSDGLRLLGVGVWQVLEARGRGAMAGVGGGLGAVGVVGSGSVWMV